MSQIAVILKKVKEGGIVKYEYEDTIETDLVRIIEREPLKLRNDLNNERSQRKIKKSDEDDDIDDSDDDLNLDFKPNDMTDDI